MNEQTKRSAGENKEEKKDYYSAVIVSQIICAVLLTVLFTVFIKTSDSLKSEFMSYIGKEMFDTSSAIASLKEYLSSDNSWAVFGSNVTNAVPEYETAVSSTDETTDANLTGTGGEDLTIYEAAKNTSYAHIKTTVPAIKPVDGGRYTSYFGYRINPITGEFSFHTGLDIAAEEGTKIRAAYSGVVTRVGEDSRAGKYVFLTHDDGFVTFYCHCSEILVGEGAVIRQGETIAKVGTTGWSTGPHLHFEIRKDNIRYNPIFILENDS